MIGYFFNSFKKLIQYAEIENIADTKSVITDTKNLSLLYRFNFFVSIEPPLSKKFIACE